MNELIQQRIEKKTPPVNYSYGAYNKYDEKEQWIRLTEGCPHNCPWCYEPQEIKIFKVPEIVRNSVKIMDMNPLCKKEFAQILKELPIKNDGKNIVYEFICGIDYRFLTKEIAEEMKRHHFNRVRFAWDWYYHQQLKIKDTLKMLYAVGYNPRDIIIFMICNHPSISYEENCDKLDICKIWNVCVADCYYDNQINIIKGNFIPIGWNTNQAQTFRRKVRKHNLMVKFQIDPMVIGK